jgi:hypothetical protein
VTAAEEFIEFATGASPRLRRTAFLLCGNWHTAEDLAQTTLAKMYASWRRIRAHEHVYAYANRTLVNSYLADRHRLRARELLAGWLPERPAEPQTPELRIEVLNALVTLPPKARVVVLMRYWADMSVTAGRPIEVGSRGHGDDPERRDRLRGQRKLRRHRDTDRRGDEHGRTADQGRGGSAGDRDRAVMPDPGGGPRPVTLTTWMATAGRVRRLTGGR